MFISKGGGGLIAWDNLFHPTSRYHFSSFGCLSSIMFSTMLGDLARYSNIEPQDVNLGIRLQKIHLQTDIKCETVFPGLQHFQHGGKCSLWNDNLQYFFFLKNRSFSIVQPRGVVQSWSRKAHAVHALGQEQFTTTTIWPLELKRHEVR